MGIAQIHLPTILEALKFDKFDIRNVDNVVDQVCYFESPYKTIAELKKAVELSATGISSHAQVLVLMDVVRATIQYDCGTFVLNFRGNDVRITYFDADTSE